MENIRTKPTLNLREAFEKGINHSKKNQVNADITFDEFLEGMGKVADAGEKVMKIAEKFTNIKDQLEADLIYENLKIKPFGISGAHITLPSEFIGKTAKVIIKK